MKKKKSLKTLKTIWVSFPKSETFVCVYFPLGMHHKAEFSNVNVHMYEV